MLNNDGYLHLVIGPMFAGKSSHLISLTRRYRAINISVLIVKHTLDQRYGKNHVCSHDMVMEECLTCDKLLPILTHEQYVHNKVIIIEEAQFFDDLEEFVKHATDRDKKHVVIYGLNGDFKRKPFGNILNVIPLANQIEKLGAYCYFCKDLTLADYTLRTTPDTEQIVVGESDKYKPVCRKHYLEKSH